MTDGASSFVNGEKYSGTPSENLITDYNEVAQVKNFFRGNFATEIATDHVPSIKDEDVRRGYITRYFVRQTNHSNESQITEIDKNRFVKLQNIPLFMTTEIRWKISGDLNDKMNDGVDILPKRMYTGVLTANKLSAEEGDKILHGLKKKLSNYRQYYQGE